LITVPKVDCLGLRRKLEHGALKDCLSSGHIIQQ